MNRAAALLLMVMFTPVATTLAAISGPDAERYLWYDSDEPGGRPYVPPFAPGPLLLSGDEVVVEVPLPASVFPAGFPYRGLSYPSVWLSSNGWFSFVDPLGQPHPLPSALPSPASPSAQVAFLWDDFDSDVVAGVNDTGDGFTLEITVVSRLPVASAKVSVTFWVSGCITIFYGEGIEALISPRTVIGQDNVAGSIGLSYMDAGVASAGASFRGEYSLDFCSGGTLPCPAPPRVLALNSPAPYFGDTSVASNDVSAWHCAGSGFDERGDKVGFTGPEEVWEVTLPDPAVLWLGFQASDPDLRAFVVRDCNEGNCLFEGGGTETLPAGTYQVVVDGRNGAAGAYSLWPRSAPPVSDYNLWFGCPEGNQQSEEQKQSRLWKFDSMNFCGTGCDFSLFAVVGCGTEMHIPMFDVETGRMQVRDVFTGRDVDLVATNRLPVNTGLPVSCELETSGTTVEWVDNTCTSSPCPIANCGGGGDCRTNALVRDVSWLGAPNLCGVFELKFQSWGGFVWEAYANCTRDRTEQFAIYRDLPAALTAWSPHPEIGISNYTFNESDCGSQTLTGTFTLENAGCVDALQVPVTLDEQPPAISHPRTFLVDVPAGSQVTISWDYIFLEPTASLMFRVDPDNVLLECSEALGSTVACGNSATLLDEQAVVACDSKCASRADAGTLVEICTGAAAVLDGDASYLRCTLPATAEYRWTNEIGAAVAGCDWGPSSRCVVPASNLPLGKSRFELGARCSGPTVSCETNAGTAVIVGRNLTPAGAGNSLRAARSSRSIGFDWSSAPSLPVASWRLYRDGDPVLPGPTRSLALEIAVPGTSGDETGGVDLGPALAFYQLVGVSCGGDLEGGY